MQRGRKTADPAAKQLANTYRPDRHGSIKQLAETPSDSPPIKPDYLSDTASQIWDEELERVVRLGNTDDDSSLFARYCEVESLFRASVQGKLPIVAGHLVELRKMAELLGIAGVRSRLVKSAISQGAATADKTSAFSVRPK